MHASVSPRAAAMPCSTAPLRPCSGLSRTISRTGYRSASCRHTSTVASRLPSSTMMISYGRPARAASTRGTSSGMFSASCHAGTTTDTSGVGDDGREDGRTVGSTGLGGFTAAAPGAAHVGGRQVDISAGRH